MIQYIWRCDGCGKEADGTERAPSDWSQVTVTVTGLAKYPVCMDDRERQFELCPDCQRKLGVGVNPDQWDKPTSAVGG